MRARTKARIFPVCAMCVCFPLLAQAQARRVSVPFVGCKSYGQSAVSDAPNGENLDVPIAADAARQLAYYKTSRGVSVLAPRGWYCLAQSGSGGEELYVSPAPEVFSANWRGFAGPAIEAELISGENSGRYDIAKMIARVFPVRRALALSIIEGVELELPTGPYPSDRLTYKSSEIVEYDTPAQADGLGTESRLLKNGMPISGVVVLIGQQPGLLHVLHLSARLPAGLAALTPVIIQQAERDAQRH